MGLGLAAGLADAKGRPPEQSQIDRPLQIMAEAVRDRDFSHFADYDAAGAPVMLE